MWSGIIALMLRVGIGALIALGLVACDTERPDSRPTDGADVASSEPPPDPPAPARMEVTVYFTRDEQPVPVTREIPATVAVLRGTLEALLAGPTPEEREVGIFSWFSEETASMLHDVDLRADGLLVVDFRDFSRVIPNASTSAGSRILLNELNATVFEFDEVEAVRFHFDSDCDAFWNWLQRGCATVTRPDRPID